MAATSTLPDISLDFSYFDNLYNGDTGQYAEMLDLYMQEYAIYRRIIAEALTGANEGEFRKAKHKIIYSLHLLKLEGVKQHLDELGNRFAELPETELPEEAKAMDEVFSAILEKLAGKKAVIV